MRKSYFLLALALLALLCVWLGAQAFNSPSSDGPTSTMTSSDPTSGHDDETSSPLETDAALKVNTALGNASAPSMETVDTKTQSSSEEFGKVRVHVEDTSGNAIAGNVRGYVFWRPTDNKTARWSRDGVPLRLTCPRGKLGELNFERVPVGHEIKIDVHSEFHFVGTKIGVSPLRAGEQVNWTLALGDPKPVIVMRLVDAEGNLMDWKSVRVQLKTRGQPPVANRWGSLNADGVGVLRYRPPALQPPEGPLDLWLESAVGEVVYRAHAQLPHPLQGDAETDIGTLQFVSHATPRVIARGRVLSEDGTPMHRVSISAGFRRPDKNWQTLHREPITTDREGRFEVRSPQQVPNEYFVRASKSGWIGAGTRATPDSGSLTLTLVRGGQLRGNYVIPPGIPEDRLVIRAVPVGESASGGPNQGGGYFAHAALREGSYDVVVRVKGTPWEILRMGVIEVKAGELAQDERLHNISIRGLVRATTFRLFDSEGKPLGVRAISARDDQGRGCSVRVKDGTAIVVTPATVSALTLRVGDAFAEVSPDGGAHDVHLMPSKRKRTR